MAIYAHGTEFLTSDSCDYNGIMGKCGLDCPAYKAGCSLWEDVHTCGVCGERMVEIVDYEPAGETHIPVSKGLCCPRCEDPDGTKEEDAERAALEIFSNLDFA